MFNDLDDRSLLEAYYEAVRNNLEIDFISILKEEIDARGLINKNPKPEDFIWST
ncbi:sporulation histidine kinase inhibitor Sda [Alkalihalobacillus deserti]|uniref:sporulation histidine kinase inhibitor Sda n=1 Tax=Alkalihalobacillus deserti TaxID=2879466 RepID=UPI001D1393AF|nr:sporulation histidine kinase inhibitor Sda [Alkalihalobacillus deserti]